MDQRAILKKTMTLARTGDPDAFENFYILTVQETYGYACSLLGEGSDAQKLLTDVYVHLYRRAHTLPVEEEPLMDRICDELYRLANKRYGVEAEDFSEAENFPPLSDEKATAIWIEIEEKSGFSRAEELEEGSSPLSYVYSFLKIVLTILVLAATVVILYKGWMWFYKDNAPAASQASESAEETAGTKAAEIVIESEKLEPDWERKPDGKLYYVKKDGSLADGALTIGKQTLTFSRDGELTLIGSSKAVTENPNRSFDEATLYEVRDGDLYQKEPDQEEVCVVRNGHIVQADVRCGFLWYISKYQVPNSDQVKTSIYRAETDGEKAEEVYSTNNMLETDSFQVTEQWLYYLSNGELFRKSLSTGDTEFLAEHVEYYFAWEDTAYYMNDRTLESVSEGSDYSGIEAGYRIELEDRGFVLYDTSGSEVTADENGEKEIGDRIYLLENGVIRSVRPSARTDGEITYYIGDAGSDRKIYWKSKSGSQGMLMQEGLMADSLCLTGDWLYYSARIAQYGAESESQIYRINLQSMELEKVGVSFRGYMKELYYFDSLQMIFGEYIPSLADPEDIHGAIAAMPVGGEMGMVNDTGVRPTEDGSDLLEMVMADGSQIYCLYHRVQYDGATGETVYTETEPMVIKFRSGGN